MKVIKKALITGITGQDGSYLAELLLSKGYEVHGIMRRSSNVSTLRIDHLFQDPHETDVKLFLHYGDLSDSNRIRQLIYKIEPDEFYNLGAQSHVRVSFDTPEYTADVTGLGALRILEAIKDFEEHSRKKVRYYQASSSEMFGSTPPPQNEQSTFHPRSPYGCSKVFGYNVTVNYREGYDIFGVNGILFNHESPRRGISFVTRKIARGVAEIHAGKKDKLHLGNLEAVRDWGYAPEYMEAAWLMLQQPEPGDFVIGTGEGHTVREFVISAFSHAGFDNWEKYVEHDSRYLRPSEVEALLADPQKAKRQLGWDAKVRFNELVRIMVDAEIKNFPTS